MANYFSDNQMNYYQFKAKQLLLQKKEEKEWQNFCKEIAPDCAACYAEKANLKESKDVGIQTFPKKTFPRTDKTPLQSKSEGKEIPEALVNIKTQLEKIDLALSKLLDESSENEKVLQKFRPSERKPVIQEKNHLIVIPTFHNQQPSKTFEEQKKLEIQNKFKANLQNSVSVIRQKSSAIRPKNSSFFLPHDLEVKRAAARKAYLASLQTKPKVSFLNKKPINEKTKVNQNKKNIPVRKKVLPKKENPKSKEENEETLVGDFAADNAKDENIEGVVDAILEDLLGEAALDLNRIRQKKREKAHNIQSEVSDKVNKSSILHKPSSALFPTKCDSSNLASNSSNSIMKLKMFIDSTEVIQDRNDIRQEQIELKDQSTSTANIEEIKIVPAGQDTPTSNFQKKQETLKNSPKFVCGVTNLIKIDPEKAKNIASRRDRFWRYLESISQTARGDFNPWILNEMLAESILDDCIKDIAKELSEMPINIIQELYNQEFIQQVKA